MALNVGMLVRSHVILLLINPIVCTERRAGRFQHELYDGGGLRNLRGMINVVRTDLSAHAVGHETLCLRAEHTIVFSQ